MDQDPPRERVRLFAKDVTNLLLITYNLRVYCSSLPRK